MHQGSACLTPKIGGEKMLIKSPEKHPYVLYQCENAYLLVIESIIHAIRIISTEFFTGRFFGSSPPLELVTSSESSLDARSGEGWKSRNPENREFFGQKYAENGPITHRIAKNLDTYR